MSSRELACRAGVGLLLLCTAWLVVENGVLLAVLMWSRSWGAFGTAAPWLAAALAVTLGVTLAVLATGSMAIAAARRRHAGAGAWAHPRACAGEERHG